MFYFITDALSTVRDVVNSSGTVVASYEFSEYGQKISPTNTNGVESQKTFVGGLSVQDEVADTGLMLMGHRFYDPGLLGRFLNRDPIGYAGGMNLYGYAGANSVQYVDSNGLEIFNPSQYSNWANAQGENTRPLTEEERQDAGEFVLGFNPVIGAGLSARDFYNHPGLWTGTVLVFSLAGFGFLRKTKNLPRVKRMTPESSKISTFGATPASDELISSVGKKRTIKLNDCEEELSSYVGGKMDQTIYLGKNPLKAEVLEEFLHGTQKNLGLSFDNLASEVHVKEFMMRHRKILGLNEADVRVVSETLRRYLGQ